MPRVTAAGASAPAALARRDAASLRWIRARVAVQLRLLDRLGEREDVCVRSGCLRAALPAIQQLQAATDLLAAGTANAPGVEWSKAWSATELAIRPGGQPVVEAGLAQGTPDAAPISAPVRLFADTCREGGGRVDDTGGVRALPTTEGGWTCWSVDKACWHFLTHSGALYTFGGTGVGCPPLAALPARLGGIGLAEAGVARVADPPPAAGRPAPNDVPVAPAAPVEPPVGAPPMAPPVPPTLPDPPRGTAFGFDGTYRLRLGEPSCTDGRVVDRRQALGFLGIPYTDTPTLIVRERRLLGVVPSAAIDANGLVSANGNIGTNIRTTDRLQFSSRGDSAVFTAEHTRLYAADQVSCHLVYEGERVAP